MKTFIRALSLFTLVALAFPAAAAPLSTEEALADRVLGDPDAPVEMIGYESLTCPHCASFHADAWPELKEKYIETGKVKFVYRDFPFDALGLRAAMMARCAPQDKYFGTIEALYKSQRHWTRADDPMKALEGIARLAGLDSESFDACMANNDLLDGLLLIRQNAETGEFEVSSTPTFIINGVKIEGARPLADYESIFAPMIE